MRHDLEIRTALPAPGPKGARALPPLLFVHGAYCDAWCWAVHMLPWFASRGFAAHALSLRGHGKSPGRDEMGSVHLSDYIDDIRDVVGTLGQRPILVGHSMGAALVERLIADEPFPGAALVSPVPPSGLLPVLTRLWWGRPQFFLHAHALHDHMNPVSASTLREFYFTERAPQEILHRAMRHLSPESPSAVMELTWKGRAFAAEAASTPVTVIAGGADALFTPRDAQATASRYGTEAIVLEGLPHMMMLEPGWELLAETIARWIDTVVPGSSTAAPAAPATPASPASSASPKPLREPDRRRSDAKSRAR